MRHFFCRHKILRCVLERDILHAELRGGIPHWQLHVAGVRPSWRYNVQVLHVYSQLAHLSRQGVWRTGRGHASTVSTGLYHREWVHRIVSFSPTTHCVIWRAGYTAVWCTFCRGVSSSTPTLWSICTPCNQLCSSHCRNHRIRDSHRQQRSSAQRNWPRQKPLFVFQRHLYLFPSGPEQPHVLVDLDRDAWPGRGGCHRGISCWPRGQCFKWVQHHLFLSLSLSLSLSLLVMHLLVKQSERAKTVVKHREERGQNTNERAREREGKDEEMQEEKIWDRQTLTFTECGSTAHQCFVVAMKRTWKVHTHLESIWAVCAIKSSMMTHVYRKHLQDNCNLLTNPIAKFHSFVVQKILKTLGATRIVLWSSCWVSWAVSSSVSSASCVFGASGENVRRKRQRRMKCPAHARCRQITKGPGVSHPVRPWRPWSKHFSSRSKISR